MADLEGASMESDLIDRFTELLALKRSSIDNLSRQLELFGIAESNGQSSTQLISELDGRLQELEETRNELLSQVSLQASSTTSADNSPKLCPSQRPGPVPSLSLASNLLSLVEQPPETTSSQGSDHVDATMGRHDDRVEPISLDECLAEVHSGYTFALSTTEVEQPLDEEPLDEEPLEEEPLEEESVEIRDLEEHSPMDEEESPETLQHLVFACSQLDDVIQRFEQHKATLVEELGLDEEDHAEQQPEITEEEVEEEEEEGEVQQEVKTEEERAPFQAASSWGFLKKIGLSEIRDRLQTAQRESQGLEAAVQSIEAQRRQLDSTLAALTHIERGEEETWKKGMAERLQQPEYLAWLTFIKNLLQNTTQNTSDVLQYVFERTHEEHLRIYEECQSAKDWEGAMRALEEARFSRIDDPDLFKMWRFCSVKAGYSFDGDLNDEATGEGVLYFTPSQSTRSILSQNKTFKPRILYRGGMRGGLKHGIGTEYKNGNVTFVGCFDQGKRHGRGAEFTKGATMTCVGEWYSGRLIRDTASDVLEPMDLSMYAEAITEVVTIGGVGAETGPARIGDYISDFIPVIRIQTDEQTEFSLWCLDTNNHIESSLTDYIVSKLKGISQIAHTNLVVPFACSMWPLGVCAETGRPSVEDHYLVVEGTKLTWTKKLTLLLKAARAIHYLHMMGLVHGFLTWDCCHIDPEDEAYGLKISSFGLYDILSWLCTVPPSLHTAPELHIWSGAELEPSGDAFAFGMMMYEILKVKALSQMSQEDGISISDVRDGWRPVILPSEISYSRVWYLELMHRCLDADKTKRPAFDEIVEMLELALYS